MIHAGWHHDPTPGYQRTNRFAWKRINPWSTKSAQGSRYPILAALTRDLACPTVLILPRVDLQNIALDELSFWSPGGNLLTYPEPTPLFYEKAAWGGTTRRERLRSLAAWRLATSPVRIRKGKRQYSYDDPRINDPHPTAQRLPDQQPNDKNKPGSYTGHAYSEMGRARI